MTSNPPLNIPLVLRPPTRIVASGTITIAAGSYADFIGSNARQDRIQIIITVLDPVLNLKVQTLNGVNFGTVFALLPWTVETSADIRIYNNNGSDVQLEVGELYPDTGNAHGVPSRLASVVSGGSSSPGSGGSSSGGSTGGSSGSGLGGGGSQLR